jgi:hypothetical protein
VVENKKHDEFLNLIENVLWEASADLEGSMLGHSSLPDHINKEIHTAAASAAIRTSMDMLRMIAREYKRINKLPGTNKKCCKYCEQRIERWQKLDFGYGEFLYDNRSPDEQVKNPIDSLHDRKD